MRRLRTEIMLHTYLPEIWIVELLEDDEQRYVIQRHWGHMNHQLNYRLDHKNEFFEEALNVFEKKVSRKRKRDKNFRQAGIGENIFCADLFRIFGGMFQERRDERVAQTQNEPEHRRLEL